MSDPAIRPIPGSGEPKSDGRVWPTRPAVPAASLLGDAKTLPADRVPEPDRMELASTGAESYAVFSVQPKTGIVTIKIVDAKTDQVIRQMPSEEILHVAEQVQSYLAARRQHGKRG